MPTKVVELEISEKLLPLWGSAGCDSALILVRYQKRPLGWVWVSIPNPEIPMISAEQLRIEITNQLGWELIQSGISQNIGQCQTENESSEPISIVVCTRDRTAQLKACLSRLLSLNYPNYEIIVVDNAPSTEETAKLVADLPVHYIRENRLGIAWARNRGVVEARHNIIAFTDDDALVDHSWLHSIAKAFSNPEVMTVTGFVAPAELETHAQLLFEFDYGGMSHGFNRRIVRRDTLTERELLWASSFGVTANAAFRRHIFSKVGLFDVALCPNSGGEDIEMFHRIVAQGFTLVYEPSVLVWHTHRRHLPALYQQIYNNCRSFGCYLLTCSRNRSVSRISLLQFFLYDWLTKWIFSRLIRPPRNLPRRVVLTELAGMLASPLAYRKIHAARSQSGDFHLKLKLEQHQSEEVRL